MQEIVEGIRRWALGPEAEQVEVSVSRENASSLLRVRFRAARRSTGPRAAALPAGGAAGARPPEGVAAAT